MIVYKLGDVVSALCTEILVKHGVTLDEFKNGPITADVKAAALEMSQSSILLDRSFLQQHMGILSTRMKKILCDGY